MEGSYTIKADDKARNEAIRSFFFISERRKNSANRLPLLEICRTSVSG
jgi:hypothetical protein